jgi:hypothetical protein
MAVLFPCPGCNLTKNADEGHHLCRECEGYKPIPKPSETIVRDSDGEIVYEASTHAEAWYWVIASGNKSYNLYEGDVLLYHQPSLVM